MIILSVMWSTIFCLSTTAWVWYGELVVGHTLVILGIAVTAMTFQASAKKQVSTATYRDHPREDGTSRYDDVWVSDAHALAFCIPPLNFWTASPAIKCFRQDMV